MPPRPAENALLNRVESQLDELTRTVNALSTFVQSKIAATDSAIAASATSAKRWWDVTWPQHEAHHVTLQERVTAIETAISRAAENAAAIGALTARIAALETLRHRGEGAAWLARALWAAGGGGLIYFLTHALHLL